MKTVGFLINPMAGMGGKIGLKGTDGLADLARVRGADSVSPGRAEQALRNLAGAEICFLTCSGEMGEDVFRRACIKSYKVVYHSGVTSTAEDTKRACQVFLVHRPDIIVFCGGDGTARDVFDVVRRDVPLLGIPAGVKMFSAVFALNPYAAADILKSDAWVEHDGEILDIDEDAYRQGELRTLLYGYARVPYLPGKTQIMKQEYDSQDEDQAKNEISSFIKELMHSSALYILGPGTTTAQIANHIGVKKTLLGFDAVKDNTLIGKDLNEMAILDLITNEREVWAIISPIGAQGAILGRGNQQLSPQVVKKIGLAHLIVVATPYKLSQIPSLFVDTGDPDLDRQFGDFISVISGYRIAQRKRLNHPGTD